MPRIIVFLILGFLIYRYFKRLAAQSAPKTPAAGPAKAISFAPIAACAVCGVHIPLAESISSADGRTFCSEAHSRLAHVSGH